jgi:tRNA pseudouridine55 synthase
MLNSNNGILLVNKDAGWTSHDVCQFVKKRFGFSKVGHTGTLDPQATGVLVLLLGKFTKYSAEFVGHDKVYKGTIELGKTTSSQDGEGEVIEQKPWQHLSPEQVQRVIDSFRGEQDQIPPMVSALRSKGKRLYALARKGITVKREARKIMIYSIHCDQVELPAIDFTVHVSKGTYVRTIAHDVGQKLGTGAFLRTLCRIRSGMYSIESCVRVDTLKSMTDKEGIRQYIISELPSSISAEQR